MQKDLPSSGNFRNLWLSALFIAGNAIGAGVLGLPVVMAGGGFFAASLGCVVVYLLMLGSGFIFSDLFCGHHRRDLPTFFREHLGKFGFFVFSIAYFTLFLCLLVAYWSGLGAMFRGNLLGVGLLLFAVLIVALLLRSNFVVLGRMVSALSIAFVAVFFALIVATFFHPHCGILGGSNWKIINGALPVLLCSYGFQATIPVVCRQLNFRKNFVRRALLLGTLFPLFFNLAILFIAFRVLTPNELIGGMDRGLPVFLLFREKFLSPSFVILGEAFSFFAISSSLLGVSATLSGALKDVFHGHRWYVGVTEISLVVLLPLTIAQSWSHLFIRALEVSGGIFLNIIAGILPLAVALRRRSMPALGWVYLAGFSYILAIEFVRIFL